MAACERLLDAGCACILPTVITSPVEVYAHVLPLLADACESERLRGRVLGIHLEGPFISDQPGAVGCHPPAHVLDPANGGIALFDQLMSLSRGHVRLLTIAAEGRGAAELCAHAIAAGVVVSLGHQLATAEQIHELAACGASLLTHLGNGCPAVVNRHANPIWAGLAEDRLSAMLITDGVHLPRDVLVAMLRAKGLSRVIVTSDVAPVACLPCGTYQCFGSSVHVEGSAIRSADRSCLAGSGALMLECMNHLAGLRAWVVDEAGVDAGSTLCTGGDVGTAAGGEVGLSLEQLLLVGFDNPLRALGLSPESTRRALEAACVGPLVEWCGGQFRLRSACPPCHAES
uniref:N-acetylglucosamine-6-phosphate deacetylase n=1 Tax=Haptolina ericina TaxID=156174 RepID=A0A7S3FHF8_9EUKA